MESLSGFVPARFRARSRIYLVFCILALFANNLAFAQEDPADKLPMYGQPAVVRSDVMKKADDVFIRESSLRYGNRNTASRALALEGWIAARRGVFDVAMRRFNQSWLLNPKNYQAFWGFGAILSEQGKLLEALEQLETARQLLDEPAQRAALLADLGAVSSEYGARLPASQQLDRAQYFIKANQYFTESLENNPNFAVSWREWAISLNDQERYSEAWVKAQKAQELKAESFPPEFLKKLRDKVPQAK
jgi:tetratricopeptide (TPR) repeat protein